MDNEREGQAQAEARTAARIARDAAVEQAAATLAYIGITVLVSVAVIKRDALWRLWRRLTTRPTPPETAAATVALAEVRREISRMEHAHEARPARPYGLYEIWGRPS
jgi:hypothetical protein